MIYKKLGMHPLLNQAIGFFPPLNFNTCYGEKPSSDKHVPLYDNAEMIQTTTKEATTYDWEDMGWL